MMRHILAAVFILVVFLPVQVYGAAGDEKRVALVIGNSDYEHVSSLPNPSNDARDLSVVLENLGFEVTSGLDLDYRELRLALRDFGDEAADADVALIYFAGHGIEIDKINYLIPVNAELRSDRDVEFETIRLDSVISSLDGAKGVRIVLLDACRNNPFLADMQRTTASRSIGRGLGRIDPGGVLVGYAARGGTIALDGDGRNSPYAKALLKSLETPGLEIGKLFRRVRDLVLEDTEGFQEPFTYGSLPGKDIFLKPPEPVKVAVSVPNPVASPLSNDLLTDFAEAEKRSNLNGWSEFLEKHGEDTDNALVKIAVSRRSILQEERVRKQRSANRKPLIEPEFSSTGIAMLDRNQSKLVQQALAYMGHYTGPIDGDIGPRSRQAISAARLASALTPGTQIDRMLLRALPDIHAIESLKSEKVRKYKEEELPIGLEPRLQRVMDHFTAPYGRLPIKFEYFEGHLYVLVYQTFGNFESATRDAAKVGGHIVTIQSAAENRFLIDLFKNDRRFIHREPDGALFGPMIGLFQQSGSPEPRGGWSWVTGEPLTYTAWSPGNPDNFMGRQHRARFYLKAKMAGPNSIPRFWDDTSNGLWNLGYIIEIE